MAIGPISYQPQQAFSGGVDFSQLGKLGEVYREAQNRERLSDLGKQLANGSITYQQAAGQIADMGDINSTLKFLALSEQEKQRTRAAQASKDFLSGFAPPSASSTIAGPPSVAPTVDVAPNPAESTPTRTAAVAPTAPAPPADAPIRLNRDGTIAGNLTSPTDPDATPAPAPAAPSFDQRFAAARPQGTTAATGAPSAADVPRMLAAISNPDLPEGQKEIAKEVLKRAWDSAKPTEKISTLQSLKDSDPALANKSLYEIEVALRKFAKSDVNILPGEKKYDEKMGEVFSDIHSGYIKDAAGASKVKNTLDVMERAANAPGYYSGTAAPAVLAAQRAGVSLGLLDADKAGPTELFDKMSKKLVTDVAGGGGGGLGSGVSNADRSFIEGTVPNISNTPDGNKKIIGMMRLVEDRKVETAKEVARYAKAHGGRIDYDLTAHLEKWANEHPLDFEKIPGLKRVIIDTPRGGQATHKNIPFTVNP